MQYPDRIVDFPIGLSMKLSQVISTKNGAIIFFFSDVSSISSQITIRGFRANYDNLTDLGYELIGISTNSQEDLDMLNEELNLKYVLKSDETYEISESLNVIGVQTDNPNLPRLSRYSTFIVDNQLQIMKVFDQIHPRNHASDVYSWIANNEVLSHSEKNDSILQDG